MLQHDGPRMRRNGVPASMYGSTGPSNPHEMLKAGITGNGTHTELPGVGYSEAAPTLDVRLMRMILNRQAAAS